jgi:hypothetical protein
MHLVRTISVAVVALGLMVQAAQARPFGIAPGGAAARASAPSQQASARGLNLLAGVAATPAASHRPSGDTRDWTESLLSSDSSQASTSAAGASAMPTVLHQAVVTASGTASVSRGVYWISVLGGAAIIALIGGLIVAMSRQQPQRPQKPAIV